LHIKQRLLYDINKRTSLLFVTDSLSIRLKGYKLNNGHNLDTTQQWLKLTVEGDKQAFGEFYSFYLNEIYRYVYFRVHNHHEAEDLTETAFLNAWKYLTAGRNKTKIDNPRAWIYRIAHNTVIDHFRTRKEEIPIEQLPVPSQPFNPTETDLIYDEKVEQLTEHFSKLEAKYQEVIILRFINQMSHAETAQVLGIKENHVRILQYRALKQLRQFYESGTV
jgi:RNA polymerase sigma-70 factor, ECF subfamily